MTLKQRQQLLEGQWQRQLSLGHWFSMTHSCTITVPILAAMGNLCSQFAATATKLCGQVPWWRPEEVVVPRARLAMCAAMAGCRLHLAHTRAVLDNTLGRMCKLAPLANDSASGKPSKYSKFTVIGKRDRYAQGIAIEMDAAVDAVASSVPARRPKKGTVGRWNGTNHEFARAMSVDVFTGSSPTTPSLRVGGWKAWQLYLCVSDAMHSTLSVPCRLTPRPSLCCPPTPRAAKHSPRVQQHQRIHPLHLIATLVLQ